MKETELFEPVKNIFQSFDYEIYSEVKGKYFKNRADIVATKPDKLLVIELKTSLSFKLIDQARFWLKFADYVYVAVPKTKTETSETALDVLKYLGIGLIVVDMKRYKMELLRSKEETLLYSKYAEIVLQPKQNEIIPRYKKQFDNLTEEHKTWSVGGSKGGKYVTPYGLLMNDVYAFLRKQLQEDVNDGWVTTTEIFDYMKENSRESVIKHYKNPKSSIGKAIDKYEISDIERTKMGNRIYYKIMPESTKYLNLGIKKTED